jgi:hypothetical protein
VNPVLAWAVVLVTAVSAVNLLLVVLATRRLNALRAALGPLVGRAARPPLEVGRSAPAFTATAVDGEPVSRTTLAGADPTVLALFTTDCPACESELAAFVRYAATLPGRRQAVAVVRVHRPEAAVDELVSRLTPVARVVVEPPKPAVVSAAFGTVRYPMFYAFDRDAVAVAVSPTVASLPAPSVAG